MANRGVGFTVWLTGMLGAGKTTLAEYVAARLRQVGRNVEILDEETLSPVLPRTRRGISDDTGDLLARDMPSG